MKNFLKIPARILLLTIIMAVLWMVFLSVGDSLFHSEIPSSGVSPAVSFLLFLAVCLINSTVLLFMIRYSTWNFTKTAITVFVVLFGIQFFLSLIEAYVFNNAIRMPLNLLLATFTGGFLMSALFAPLAVWIGGRSEKEFMLSQEKDITIAGWEAVLKILLLSVFIYPALYQLAGYYIAWQSEAVRMFYTNSAVKEPFLVMLGNNFKSGLMYIAMARGIIWVFIGILIYRMTSLPTYSKAILVGALFALIMNSQHLIPNPYMPRAISTVHFIETASSNFIWGFLVVWIWSKPLFSNGHSRHSVKTI